MKLAHVAAFAFATQIAALDAVVRGPVAYATEPRLLLGLAASTALLYLVSTLAARRSARAAIAIATGALVVTEAMYVRYYHGALDAQAVAAARHSWIEVRAVLALMAPRLVALTAIAAAVEWALLALATQLPARRTPAAVVFVAAFLAGPPVRDGTPEVRLLQAATLLAKPHVSETRARGTIEVPPLPSTREELPSVLLLLTESVRASSYGDDVAHQTLALVPARVTFPEMRAVSSYTAVSVSALFTGRTQEGPRGPIVEAPTMFDLVRAVRARDRRPTVAYWSAQSEQVFERADTRASVDSFVTLETLLGHAVSDEDEVIQEDVDRKLAEYAAREMPKLPRPFFLVLHFFGTHAPYYFDASHARYEPWDRTVTWSGMDKLRNAYKNAIVEQDHSIATAVRAFFEATKSGPHAVLFTSDHGEAFGEHGAIHHGQNLYDEQIHVPAWIAHGGGALSNAEAADLASNEHAWLTHLDVLPTILDLYGAWNSWAYVPYRAKLEGRSLLAAAAPMAHPVPITNCTQMFPCPINTWGVLFEDRALEAQRWDGDWRCIDLRAESEIDPRDPFCIRLRDASKMSFPELPNQRPNL